VADLENYRKRAQREREEVQKFGIERVVKDLLPVVDNLDRALAAAPEGDPLAGGVKLVLKVLEEALARHGVQTFRALGETFDPRRHEAIMTVATAEQPPGTIVLEHGRGFSLHDRLIRPALVGVAAAPEAPPGGAGKPTEGTG
jgi:molecular chaperone GrpE